MTDPFEALREPIRPVDPDPTFARDLRARLERALLDRTPLDLREAPMTVIDARTEATAAALPMHALTPYLAVLDARAAVEFYVGAFGARRRGEPIVMPDGRVGHVEVALGDSVLMMADEFPELGLAAPRSRGGVSQSLRLEVADPDAVVARAVALGAELERPVTDSPYGRGGVVLDPSGHRWMVSREPVGARPGDVVYASIWTADLGRAERFYADVLGWVTTAGSAGQGRQVTGTGTRLGLFGGQDRVTLMACYAVANIDAAAALVRAAGGTAGDPTEEPHGRIADCVDDQGVPFALWAGPAGTPAATGGSGDLAHLTLRVPDAGRARAFYGTVLGWRFVPARVADAWTVRTDRGEPRPRISVWGGHPDAAAVATFLVDDLAAAVQAVRTAGGTSTAPADRPYGLAADCADDQGGRFQLVQR